MDQHRIGTIPAVVVALAAFVGCWIYCVAHYGLLLGLGLGWIPALVVSAVAGVVALVLWGLGAIALGWAMMIEIFFRGAA